MKRVPMPATALAAMKKVAFAILACALLMLVAAPAQADICTGAIPAAPALCDVTITITGVAGNLSAVITDLGTHYPSGSGDDKLIGIQNNSSVKVGAIILRGASTEGGYLAVFDFSDSDGACPSCGSGGYQGPNNTFVGISGNLTTGKVLFKTPLAPSIGEGGGGSTWFSLEGPPDTTPVAIGENQTLTGGVTAIYRFGPGNPTATPTAHPIGSEDDFKFTPQKTGTDDPTGDSLTVTPVPGPAWGAGTATHFPSLACIPYFDYSTNGDGTDKAAVCVELELDCTGADLCNFQYTTQLDYGLYGDGLLNGSNSLIGGPHLLVQHDFPCPTTGFTDDILLSYTGATAGAPSQPDPPPIKGGTKPAHTCLVSAYDTNPSVPLIAQGVTITTFPDSFEFLSKSKPNSIFTGFPEFLIWDLNDSSGNPIRNLTLCPNTNCPKGGTNPPWIHLSLTVLSSTPACQGLAVDPLPNFFGLRPGDELGEYFVIWDTRTKVKNRSGCQVGVVVQLSTGPNVTPNTFQYVF